MFECVQICSVSDTLHALQRSAAVPIAPRGLSGIECRPVQRVRCPGVCVSVRGVVCLASGTACPAACAVQSVRVRWDWGLHLWGIWGEPGVGWSTPLVEKIQKRRFIKLVVIHHHPLFCAKRPTPYCQSQKFPRKNKKTPTKGLCSVLYLPYKP